VSDTTRLHVVLDAQNLSRGAFDQMRRDIEVLGISLDEFSTKTRVVAQQVAGQFRNVTSLSAQLRGAIDVPAGAAEAVQRLERDLRRVGAQSVTFSQRPLQDEARQQRERVRAHQDAAREAERTERELTRVQAEEGEKRRRIIASVQAAMVTQYTAAQRQQRELEALIAGIGGLGGAAGTGAGPRRVVTFDVVGLTPAAPQRLRQGFEAVGAEVQELGLRVDRVGRQINTLRVVPGTQAAGVQQLNALMGQLNTTGVQNVRVLGTVNTAVQTFAETTRRASGVFSGFVQGVGHGLALFTSFGAGVGIAVLTNAITRFQRESTVALGEFQRQVRATNALLGLTGDAAQESFVRMEQDVRRLGVSLGTGARAQAEALYEVISAGIPVGREAFQVLEAGSAAAIGGLTTVRTAVDGITSVLNAYRLSATEATQVSDQMFEAVNIGKITFDQLSSSIGTVVPVAAAANVSTAEMLGTIASATQQGVRAGQAIEGLRSALNAFLKPSEDARRIAEALGAEFGVAALRERGLAGALNDLTRATGGSEELLGRLLGDVQAINSAFAITGQNAPATEEAIRRIGEASGTVAKAQAEVEQSGARALERTAARWEDLRLKVGEVAAGPLSDALIIFQQVGEAVGAWPAAPPPQHQLDRFRELSGISNTLSEYLRWNVHWLQQLGRTDISTPVQAGAEAGRVTRDLLGQLRDFVLGLNAGVDEAAQSTNAYADEESRLTANLTAGLLTADEYTRALEALTQQRQRVEDVTMAWGRAEGETQDAVAASMEVSRAATEEADQAVEARKRAAEELVEVNRALTSLREQETERAQREEVARPEAEAQQALQRLQQAQRAAAVEEDRLTRSREQALASLRDQAGETTDVIGSLRDELDSANEELQRLNALSLEGTRGFSDRLFGLEQQMAERELTLAQARQAQAQARAQGVPRPDLDRASLRQAARDLAALQANADVVRLQQQITLGPQLRQLQQLREPIEEAPFAEIAESLQRARERIQTAREEIAAREELLQQQLAAAEEAQDRLDEARRIAAERGLSRQEAITQAQEALDAARLQVAEAERAKELARLAELEARAAELRGLIAAAGTTTAPATTAAANGAAGTVGGTTLQVVIEPGAVQRNGLTDTQLQERLRQRLEETLSEFVDVDVDVNAVALPTTQGGRR
jgi:TP901 family phage tail tape measure protein